MFPCLPSCRDIIYWSEDGTRLAKHCVDLIEIQTNFDEGSIAHRVISCVIDFMRDLVISRQDIHTEKLAVKLATELTGSEPVNTEYIDLYRQALIHMLALDNEDSGVVNQLPPSALLTHVLRNTPQGIKDQLFPPDVELRFGEEDEPLKRNQLLLHSAFPTMDTNACLVVSKEDVDDSTVFRFRNGANKPTFLEAERCIQDPSATLPEFDDQVNMSGFTHLANAGCNGQLGLQILRLMSQVLIDEQAPMTEGTYEVQCTDKTLSYPAPGFVISLPGLVGRLVNDDAIERSVNLSLLNAATFIKATLAFQKPNLTKTLEIDPKSELPNIMELAHYNRTPTITSALDTLATQHFDLDNIDLSSRLSTACLTSSGRNMDQRICYIQLFAKLQDELQTKTNITLRLDGHMTVLELNEDRSINRELLKSLIMDCDVVVSPYNTDIGLLVFQAMDLQGLQVVTGLRDPSHLLDKVVHYQRISKEQMTVEKALYRFSLMRKHRADFVYSEESKYAQLLFTATAPSADADAIPVAPADTLLKVPAQIPRTLDEIETTKHEMASSHMIGMWDPESTSVEQRYFTMLTNALGQISRAVDEGGSGSREY